MATVCGLLLIETATLVYKEYAVVPSLKLWIYMLVHYVLMFSFIWKTLQVNKTKKSNGGRSSQKLLFSQSELFSFFFFFELL